MIDDRIILNNIEDNRAVYRDLSIERRELIVDSMSDIMNHDQKLDGIGRHYLAQIDSPLSRKNLSHKIQTEFKYDYYRVRFLAVIKALLVIFQFYVSIVIVNSKNKNVELLWLEEYTFLFLKVLYFGCFDIEKIVHDLYFASHLQKKKFNKYCVIIYQTLDHICKLAIYIIFIIDIKNSYKTEDDEHGFHKETLEIMSIILIDIVKFLMK